MAVVPLVEREDAAPEARAAYDDIEANFGAVLEFMEQITLERRTGPEVEARLKERFSDAERVELALIGGLWNMTNRLFNSLGVELEPFVEATDRGLMRSTFAKPS